MVMDRKWKMHLEQGAKINLASATIVGVNLLKQNVKGQAWVRRQLVQPL